MSDTAVSGSSLRPPTHCARVGQVHCALCCAPSPVFYAFCYARVLFSCSRHASVLAGRGV